VLCDAAHNIFMCMRTNYYLHSKTNHAVYS